MQDVAKVGATPPRAAEMGQELLRHRNDATALLGLVATGQTEINQAANQSTCGQRRDRIVSLRLPV